MARTKGCRTEWIVIVGLALAACGGADAGGESVAATPPIDPANTSTLVPSPSTTTSTTAVLEPFAALSYEDSFQLAFALIEADYGCRWAEAKDVQEAFAGAGLSSWIDCEWPTEQNPNLAFDRIALIVHESEHHRVAGIVRSLSVSCGSSKRTSQLAYAHGEDWLILSGYLSTDLATMQAVADDLGGLANAVTCTELDAFVDSLELSDRSEDPLETMPTEVLKDALGEDPTSWQTTPAPQRGSTPLQTDAGFGDAVQDGRLEFVVSGFECGIASLDDTVGGTPEGQFCMVDLSITNISEGVWEYSYANQALVDTDGARHQPDFWGSMSTNTDVIEYLEPGASIKAAVAFDVPVEFTQDAFTDVELHESLLSPGVLVSLNPSSR